MILPLTPPPPLDTATTESLARLLHDIFSPALSEKQGDLHNWLHKRFGQEANKSDNQHAYLFSRYHFDSSIKEQKKLYRNKLTQALADAAARILAEAQSLDAMVNRLLTELREPTLVRLAVFYTDLPCRRVASRALFIEPADARNTYEQQFKEYDDQIFHCRKRLHDVQHAHPNLSLDDPPQSTPDELQEEINSLQDNLAALRDQWFNWRCLVRVGANLYIPPGMTNDVVQLFAFLLILAPDFENVPSTPRDRTITAKLSRGNVCDDDVPFKPVEGARMIKVDADVSSLLKGCNFKAVLNALSTPCPENCFGLADAIRLLALAKLCNQPTLSVVLSNAAAEALCGLEKDEQIGKGVRDCLSLLFPPPQRPSFLKRLHNLQELRNDIVHSGASAISSNPPDNHIALIAECVARRARLACRHPDSRGFSMRQIHQHYLNYADACGQQLRKILDAKPPIHSASPAPLPCHDEPVLQAS